MSCSIAHITPEEIIERLDHLEWSTIHHDTHAERSTRATLAMMGVILVVHPANRRNARHYTFRYNYSILTERVEYRFTVVNRDGTPHVPKRTDQDDFTYYPHRV